VVAMRCRTWLWCRLLRRYRRFEERDVGAQ
jgi:hypothetical protein